MVNIFKQPPGVVNPYISQMCRAGLLEKVKCRQCYYETFLKSYSTNR